MRENEIEKYIGKIFKHFKGDLYLLLDVAIHSETEEKMAVYKALYGECKTYVRPLSMFLSKVDKEKYPDCKEEYRFNLYKVGSVKE